MTSHPRSTVMTAATTAYAVYAIVRPRHLARALDAPEDQHRSLDRLALTYGIRDLATSALVLLPGAVFTRAAMGLRIAGDLGDCAVLTATTEDARVRRKVAGVTLGWATLNALAWLADERTR